MTENSLTRRQLQFVAALLESKSVSEAARRCGIGEKTGRRYLRSPAVEPVLGCYVLDTCPKPNNLKAVFAEQRIAVTRGVAQPIIRGGGKR
jgi:hypothetical protein